MKRHIITAVTAFTIGIGGGYGTRELTQQPEHVHDEPSESAITQAKNVYRDQNPLCEACGRKQSFGVKTRPPVHHRLPVNTRPDLAATHTNLVTLCSHHHMILGHPRGTRTYNPDIDSDVIRLRKIYDEIREKAVKNERLQPIGKD